MAKKVILIILGILIGLCGLGCLGLGTAGVTAFSSGLDLKSGFAGITTPTVAFVADPNKIQNSSNVSVSGVSETLKISGRNSPKPLFIGVGPTSQVNDYLSGSAYVMVTKVDFGPLALTGSVVNGTGTPAAPGDQAFWVAQATGANPQLTWKVASGAYEVVIMNADASQGVALNVQLGESIPVRGPGVVLLILGIIGTLGGLALLLWGIRSKRRQPPAAAYPGGYPGAYQTPNYQAQGYPAPGSQPPGSPPPGYQSPGYQSPGYQSPGYQQPTYPPTEVPGGTEPPYSPGQPYPTGGPSAPPPDTSTPPPSPPPSTGWQPRPPDDPPAP